jgi:hypothetical protein
MNERKCGDCQLCCRLMPMPDPPSLRKPANVRCQHQRHKKGCAIYENRPLPCAIWTCRWLGDPEATAGLPRPDHAHYLIDVVPDFITLTDTETGASHDVQIIQVWVDPAHREVYRSPALRAYLLREAEANGVAALVRFGPAGDSITLFPPCLTSSGQWHEIVGGVAVPQTPERLEKFWGGGATLEIRP